jgi:predicted ATP-grasp superfamily ATP-dependent carboligase
MYRVLLISFANWDSLTELPGVLKKGGCTVDVYCIKDSWALQNTSYARWIPANEDAGTFIEELLEFVTTNGDQYDWIIPGDDPVIRLLNDRLSSEDLFYKIMPLTKIENRALLGSKAGFSTLCEKYGIKSPRHIIYNPSSFSAAAAGAYIGYPCLMKLDKSEAGTGIFICNNETELVSNLEKATDKNGLTFQQYIKGYDINIEALYKNGELLVYSYSRVLTILGNFGLSTRRLYCRNDEIASELGAIGRSFGINGFASIAFMYSETENAHYLIEVDVRPNSWVYYGKFMGNDFSEGVKRFINNDITLIRPDDGMPRQKKIYHYMKDGSRCIVKKDVKGILDWVTNKDDCWKYIPSYDSKSLAAFNKYLSHFFTDLFRKKIKKTFSSTPQ